MTQRLLLIGVDSMDVNYLQAAADALPTMRRFLKEGHFAPLTGPGGLLAASVWPSFYTASSPGDHGHYFPLQWDAASMCFRRVEEEWFRIDPFFYGLAHDGVRVVTLDVQQSFASRMPGGVEIVNWSAQSYGTMSCNDPDVARVIQDRFGERPIGSDVPLPKSAKGRAEIERACHRSIAQRSELIRWLLASQQWDFAITVFTEAHRAGHYLWPNAALQEDGEALLQVHRHIDRELARLLATVDLDQTTVVLFSLHGMGRDNSQNPVLPAVLDAINHRFAIEREGGIPPRQRRRWMRALREWAPTGWQERIAERAPDRLRDWVINRQFTGHDWAHTPGFVHHSGTEGLLRLNLQGREQRGCLEPDSAAHREYLELVERGLHSLRAVDSDRGLVAAVEPLAPRFPGKRANWLPDLAVCWSEEPRASAIHSDSLGTLRTRLDSGRTGNHRPAAFAAILGPGQHFAEAQALSDITELAGLSRTLLERPA